MTDTPLTRVKTDDYSLCGGTSCDVEGSMISAISTSTLEYVNSQLVAHGFCLPPGLILDGISEPDRERAVKCLLGMLSQRIEDMARTEDLTTKLRTLTYDHERLRSLHRNATETAANSEREMNLHKSRLTTSTRALQASEMAHKQTTSELQRTRSLLQGVRATHQSELKKKEKDIERMLEKWSKLADAQTKLMAAPSGMRCANAAVVTGSEMIGKGQGFLEIALEEAEKARCLLVDENLSLRRLVLSAVNEVQLILHQSRPSSSESYEEPTPYTLTALFPLHPSSNAGNKLNNVINELRDLLKTLSQPTSTKCASRPAILVSDGEVERLQGIVTTLREELERSQKQAMAQAAETQAMFDKFAADHRVATRDIGELSMELMSAPLRDSEKERLDDIKKDLDLERQKFTEAAIKLGKERADLEAERIRLMDEKRSWQVEMMLAELPPTPQPTESPRRATVIRQSPKKSPRKSPAKICVGKAGTGTGRKTTRVSRRSSLISPSKIIPSYETEVLPPIPAPSFNPRQQPLTTSLLPTSFVLPPPSPHTSFPAQPALLTAFPPLNLFQSSPESQPPTPHSTPAEHVSPPDPPTVPSTPPAVRRPFPVAKPFAQRMIHAYSPAKPSPLSRILLLSNSPNSPDSLGSTSEDVSSLLHPVMEEDERVSGLEELSAPISLAAELGIPESPAESPLQEKKLEPNVAARPPVTASMSTKGRVFNPDPKRLTAKEKGKAKAAPVATAPSGRVKTSAAVEKENGRLYAAPPRVSPPGSMGETKKVAKPAPKPSTTTGVSGSRARLMAKLPPPGKGGPRRVLIDSDEAPPVGKGWRG